LAENPESVVNAIKTLLASDMLVAQEELKRSVAADNIVFPTVVVDALKKYFLEEVSIDLEYYY
jgi:hypothetical protein